MAGKITPRVQDVGEQIGDHMDAILALFKPGRKITVLVRSPDAADHAGDLLLTNDDLGQVLAAVKRRQNPAGTLEGEA